MPNINKTNQEEIEDAEIVEVTEAEQDSENKKAEKKITKQEDKEDPVELGTADKKQIIDAKSTPVTDVPEEQKAVDTSANGVAFIGTTVIVLVFGFLLGWSYTAPLESASYAPGVVAVESYRKTIQHLEGGIVNELNTKDGQVVKKGDLLIVLDETQLNAQLEITKTQYVSFLALLSRLQAEREGLEVIIFDDYLNNKAETPEVNEVIKIQQQVFNARRNARNGEVAVLKQRIDQLKEQTIGLRELQKSERKEIQLYKEEIEEFKALLKEGYTDKSRMRDMQRRVAELEGEVGKNTSAITAAKIQMGESELQILQIEKQFQLEVAEKLSESNNKINDLKERIIAIEDKITRTRILAPESGMVIGMTIHTIGGVISPEKPILEIVPQGKDLIIEAQVSPTDIDMVHTGLISEIRFSSFKSATTPIIDGVVISVSPDRLMDQNTGMPYYLARVRVTKESNKNMGDLTLMPGMPADVLIKTGKRTVFEYLVQPVSNAFARSFNED
jgi:membrane fusion protein, epimerase transport system